MIGTCTPFRMSFIGGGSDLKEFYSRHPGCVVSATINKYMYIFIHKFFDDRIQVKYSKTELVEHFSEIKHPIVREVLKKFDLKGIDINSIADIPAGTGLGSSSSYTVGLLHALYSYTDQQISAEQLAREACKIEIDILSNYLPKQLTEEETKMICVEIIKKTGASSIKDMGKVMNELKTSHSDSIDFSKAGMILKEVLNK